MFNTRKFASFRKAGQIVFTGAFLLASLSGAQADQKSLILIAKMRAAYKELKSYKAEFTREVSPASPDNLKQFMPGKGTVCLSKPDRIAIQFQPKGSEATRKSVWNGKSGYKQFSKEVYFKLDAELGGVNAFIGDFAPITIFFNLDNFGDKLSEDAGLRVKTYLGITTINGVKCNTFRATSRANRGVSITLSLDPVTNRLVREVDTIGTINITFTVSKELKGGADDKAFDPTPAAGMISSDEAFEKMRQPEKLVPQAIKDPKAEAILAETIAAYKGFKSLSGEYSSVSKSMGKQEGTSGSFTLAATNLILRTRKTPEETTYFSNGDKLFIWSKGSDTAVKSGNSKEDLKLALDEMEPLLFFFGEERMKANEPALMNARPSLEASAKVDGIDTDVLKFDYQNSKKTILLMYISHESRIILKVEGAGELFGEKFEQAVVFRNMKANFPVDKTALTFEKVFPKGTKIEDKLF